MSINYSKLTRLARWKLRGIQDVVVEYTPFHGWHIKNPLISSTTLTSILIPVWIGSKKQDALEYILRLSDDPVKALIQLLVYSPAVRPSTSEGQT